MIEKQSIDDVEVTLRDGEQITVTCVMTFDSEEKLNSYKDGFYDAMDMFVSEASSDFDLFSVVGTEELDKLKK